jgi:hypothetical protein
MIDGKLALGRQPVSNPVLAGGKLGEQVSGESLVKAIGWARRFRRY